MKEYETVIIKIPRPSQKAKNAKKEMDSYINNLNLSKKQIERLRKNINRYCNYAMTDLTIGFLNQLDIECTNIELVGGLH